MPVLRLTLDRMHSEQRSSPIRYGQRFCFAALLLLLACTVTVYAQEGFHTETSTGVSNIRIAVADFKPATSDPQTDGLKRTFDAPFFNEFVVEFPRSVKLINTQLLRDKIIGPFALGTPYPELTKRALVCVTETTSRAEIERFAGALKRTLEQPI